MFELFAETVTYYFKKQPPLLKPLGKCQKCQICRFSNSHYKVHFYRPVSMCIFNLHIKNLSGNATDWNNNLK